MGKELNKLYIKRNKLLEQLRKLEEQTTMVDYLDRVPLNIRVNNAEKVICWIVFYIVFCS